ncbi:complement C5-like [Nannospalax galili]|uniref:complement C5-like n=1 Tax=Nannospalax galili TaxID=1026970 RepID=UPI00111C345F|nr:complement C5-like [Nannospalax galili]
MVFMFSKIMGLWGIFWFLVFLGKSCGQEQRYVISVPKVFQVGVSDIIAVQAYGHTEAFDATVSVKSYPDQRFTYSSDSVNLSPENQFQNSTVLTVQLKQLSEGQSSVSYVYVEVVSKHFSISEKTPITYDNGSLFIHTDKPVYTPQQSASRTLGQNKSLCFKICLISYILSSHRKCIKTRVFAFFSKDPEGSDVDIVQGNNHTGIVSFDDFKIPSNPKYGMWTIKAKYKEDASTTGTTIFEIKEHDETYKVKEILNPAGSLKDKIEEEAAKYKHPVLKKCCYDGAHRNDHETCEQRVARITKGPLCVRAFNECCTIAYQIRANNTYKHITVMKHPRYDHTDLQFQHLEAEAGGSLLRSFGDFNFLP